MSHDPVGEPHPEEAFCPILGMVVVPVANKGIVTGPADIGFVSQMSKCVRERCMAWDGKREDCTLILGAAAMVEMKDLVDANKAKLSLLSMFGKKKE